MKSKLDLERTRAFWVASKPSEPAAPAYVPDPPLWWHVGLALVAALLFATTLGPRIAFRDAVPPLVAVLVGWYGIRAGSLRGLAFGLIAGACEDALAGATGAAWTFATGLAGLAAGRFLGTWPADMNVALVCGAALLTLFRYGAFALAMQTEGRPIALPLWHLHAVLWQALEAALVVAILLRFFPGLRGSGAHRR